MKTLRSTKLVKLTVKSKELLEAHPNQESKGMQRPVDGKHTVKKLAAENCKQAFEMENVHSLAQSHLLVVPQQSNQNIESTTD